MAQKQARSASHRSLRMSPHKGARPQQTGRHGAGGPNARPVELDRVRGLDSGRDPNLDASITGLKALPDGDSHDFRRGEVGRARVLHANTASRSGPESGPGPSSPKPDAANCRRARPPHPAARRRRPSRRGTPAVHPSADTPTRAASRCPCPAPRPDPPPTPPSTNGCPTSCCERGVSITTCGPTAPLPFGARMMRTSRRATPRRRPQRTNTKS